MKYLGTRNEQYDPVVTQDINNIEQLAVTMRDETTLTDVELFPMWAIGRAYATADRVQRGGHCTSVYRRIHHRQTGRRMRHPPYGSQ